MDTRQQAVERFAGRVGYTPEQRDSLPEDDPRARHMERMIPASAAWTIEARVVRADNCNTGYQPGDSFLLDADGNFITKRCPGRICVYLASQFNVPVALINERLSEELNPNETHFMRRVHCQDCGFEQGGYGQVMVEISTRPRSQP